MAHEILGQRFRERRGTAPAWHGLGKVFEESDKRKASEHVREIAGGVSVSARPVYYMDKTGLAVPITGQQAIIRGPVPEDDKEVVLGVTSEHWCAVDYPTIATALDGITDTYRVETVGLIKKGSLCFLALKGPDFSIQGDEMQDYFVVNLSNLPGTAHKVLVAPVKVVCSNTNLLAGNLASFSLRVQHTADAKERIQFAADLAVQFKEVSAKTQEMFNAMAQKQIDTAGVDKIVTAAWPYPNMPTELRLFQDAMQGTDVGALQSALGEKFDKIIAAQEKFEKSKIKVAALRETGFERFETFEPAHLRGTVWAAYNAATEVADWREGRNADLSSVWGERAREKASAFSAAMELITN